ncbi:hypothetical protein [Luteimonas mephitis]|jgi:hypothetical protein|uniref:hypothetical protein n=1 Tax=Luteimonas mephitis TaxID=83615 RepID=UPI0012EB59A5|nr:hypothetical protein [Luteimonas mephitis]
MKTTITGLACALMLVAATAAAQDKAPAKKIYCWDEGGHKVCGDALPPDAADAARTEISARTGITVRSVERALTDDERAAAADAHRQAALDAEAEAATKRRDLAMVESYATEDDLRRAYGERITLVEESLKTSRLGLANLRQSLLSLLRQAADLELQSKPVNKALTGNILRQHGDLLRQQAILEQQLQDRQSLGSDLEQALARYRALKSPETAATQG